MESFFRTLSNRFVKWNNPFMGTLRSCQKFEPIGSGFMKTRFQCSSPVILVKIGWQSRNYYTKWHRVLFYSNNFFIYLVTISSFRHLLLWLINLYLIHRRIKWQPLKKTYWDQSKFPEKSVLSILQTTKKVPQFFRLLSIVFCKQGVVVG